MTPIRTAVAAAALAASAGITATPAPVVPVAASTPYVAPYAPETVRSVVVTRPPALPVLPVPVVRADAMFRTPEAAMRYLAAAYNRHDLAALKHVTTPIARDSLELMRAEAATLRLVRCDYRATVGDYTCTFTHTFPASMHRHDLGHAEFTVAPAVKPGWYMTVLETCG